MTMRDRTAGYMPGQDGVLGINYTATFAKSMMSDSRLLYVNPNHADATDDGNTGENPEQPFATVAAALARCRDNRGDVIFVGQNDAWQYGGGSTWQTPIAEEVTVSVEGVSIIGVSPGSLGVTWTPVTAAGAGVCITVTALDVLISGIAFSGVALGGTAIYCLWDGITAHGENTVIENCFFDDDIDIGIQFEFAWFQIVRGCTFQECNTFGIYVDPAGSGSSYCHIYDNTFNDCAAAMGLNGCDDFYIYNNRIYNANAQAAGAATDEGIDTTAGARNMVTDNYFSCLLPVPAAGDLDDLNTASATDSWLNCHCLDGDTVTNPT